MNREEWLKAVYEAACRVAEKHGPGLRAALESGDEDGRLNDEIFHVAADAISAGGELWPFIVFSAHPEPPGDGWRKAPSFEGAVVQAAVAALAGDIRDMLESVGHRGLAAGPAPPSPPAAPGRKPKRSRPPEAPKPGPA